MADSQQTNSNAWPSSYFLQMPSDYKVTMENLDEELKTNICSILNAVSEETVNGIIHALKHAGLESLSDLELVQEEDLILVLKPIQRRKLVKAWSRLGANDNNFYGKAETSVSFCPLPSHNASVTTNPKFIAPPYAASWQCMTVPEDGWTITSESNHDKYPLEIPSKPKQEKPDELESIRLGPSKKDLQNWDKDRSDSNSFSEDSEMETALNDKSLASSRESSCGPNSELSHTIRSTPSVSHEQETLIEAYEESNANVISYAEQLDKKIKSENIVAEPTLVQNNSPAPSFKHKLKKLAFQRTITLLAIYAKYKREFSDSAVENQTVWKKIANEFKVICSVDYDGLDCSEKINELRHDYEKKKNLDVKSSKTHSFIDAARKCFEEAENQKDLAIQTYHDRVFYLTLLQVYTKYKAEFASPDIKELTVWRKIETEMRERYNFTCDESDCQLNILQLRTKYENFLNGTDSRKRYFLEEAQKAFGNPGQSMAVPEDGWTITSKSNNDKYPLEIPYKLQQEKLDELESAGLGPSKNGLQNWDKDRFDSYSSSEDSEMETALNTKSLASSRESSCGHNSELSHTIRSTPSRSCELESLIESYKELNANVTSYVEQLDKKIKSEIVVDETTSGIPPINIENELPRQNCKWRRIHCFALLKIYAMYKAELFSCSDADQQKVWAKIADEVRQRCYINCDALQCLNKMNELRDSYENIKKQSVFTRKEIMFYNEAKNVFEDTGNPTLSFKYKPRELTRQRKAFLLGIYSKYKREFSDSAVENQSVWKKIANEFKAVSSVDYDELECANKVDELRYEYEQKRNYDAKNKKKDSFIDAARKCFEETENPESTQTQKYSDKVFCLTLLQVYASYKAEFSSPDIEEQMVWRKIETEMRERYNYNCGESFCQSKILRLKNQYEKFKFGMTKRKTNPYFYEEALKAFENPDIFNYDAVKVENKVCKCTPPYLRIAENMPDGSTMSFKNIDDNDTVKISNFPNDIKVTDLSQLFIETIGHVDYCYTLKSKLDKSKCNAYFKFEKKEDAAEAMIAFDEFEFDDLTFKLEWAEPFADR